TQYAAASLPTLTRRNRHFGRAFARPYHQLAPAPSAAHPAWTSAPGRRRRRNPAAAARTAATHHALAGPARPHPSHRTELVLPVMRLLQRTVARTRPPRHRRALRRHGR